MVVGYHHLWKHPTVSKLMGFLFFGVLYLRFCHPISQNKKSNRNIVPQHDSDVVTGIHRRVRVREVLNLQLALGTSEIMLCRGTARSIHDSDWKKGLLPGSFTWPLKMYPPKRKERITNQHFSRARKVPKLNYIQFHGYIHMSSAISGMFPSSFLGSVSEMFEGFCPQLAGSEYWPWNSCQWWLFVEKNHCSKIFQLCECSEGILKKLDPGIYWSIRYF